MENNDFITDNDSNISYNSLEIETIDNHSLKKEKKELNENMDNLDNSFDLKSQLSGKLKIESEEENLKNYFSPIKERQRSQTLFSFNYKPEYVPKPKPKKTNEKVSPMKLCIRTYGNNTNLKSGKITNEVLSEYQNDLIDCLSCPENNDSSFEFDNTSDSSPLEENSFLYELRKEMKIYRNNFYDNSIQLNEYENILSIDKILLKNQKKKKKNKKFDWKKLIHQQEELNWRFLSYTPLKLKNNNNTINQNVDNIRTYSAFTPTFRNKKIMKNSSISILGILESAAKESKGRYTYNV